MHHVRVLSIALLLCALLALPACQEQGRSTASEGALSSEDALGSLYLEENRITQARERFDAIPTRDRRWANAQIGLALTRLLLLPEHPGVTEALLRLGADPARLPLRTAELARVGGVFDRMSRGASPELVREALFLALPWEVEQLEGGHVALFEALPAELELETLREPAEALDAELAAIADLLRAGLDGGAEGFTWPQGLLHSPRAYTLRRSELGLLLALTHTSRAALSGVLAYHWPISARAVLGERDASGAALDAAALAVLWNADALRAPSSGALTHWERARSSTLDALDALRAALADGLEEERAQRFGPIRWLLLGESGLAELDRMLAELEDAAWGPVALSFSESERMVSLAPLFAGAILRGVSAEALWAVGEGGGLETRDEAVKALVLDALFTPSFLPTELGPAILGTSTLRDVSLTAPGEGLRESLASDYNFY